MNYTHIVFDVDGTLLDSEDTVLLSFQKMLFIIQGKMYPLEELRFCLGIPGHDTLEKMKVEPLEDAFRMWGEFEQEFSYTMKLFKEIPSVLLQLKKNGIEMGIITSRTREEFEAVVTPFGANHYFKHIICAEDSPGHKPDPAPMLRYLELTGAKKDRVLYIGDSIYDCRCAQGAGVDFALALWGCRSPEGICPEHALKNPQDIFSL
ncbi:HAD family hydrolase [Caproiciproducens faecalis]|uniref:HAD family hydrolase n=1 Tax=Caproiciproducens faecalis TaxID=2820301 RepID=A0ABS7DJA0_9FIRM|nr:HAD family hydrolase [Caproiciproducens faecalis]MBW7571184.1 HAD family hydrolase [Caproiciproducens faecalis]